MKPLFVYMHRILGPLLLLLLIFPTQNNKISLVLFTRDAQKNTVQGVRLVSHTAFSFTRAIFATQPHLRTAFSVYHHLLYSALTYKGLY